MGFKPMQYGDSIPYYNSLKELFKNIKSKKGLEVGLEFGFSTYCYLENTKGTLLTIDLDDERLVSDDIKNRYGDRWSLIIGDSTRVLSKLKDEYDFIYIDGDHTEEGVYSDIILAYPLLSNKGIMLFDDYNQPQISKAISRYFKDKKLHLVKGNPNGAVYIIK